MAVFAGNPGDFETNPYNISWDINRKNGTMNIIEYQYKNSDGNIAGFKAGGYLHTADVIGLHDTARIFCNNYWAYLVAEKCLIPPAGKYKNGLGAFLQFDLAPADRNMVSHYLGAGLSSHGFLSGKNISDKAGVAIAYLGISKDWQKNGLDIRAHETVIEFTYSVSFFDKITLQPDLQYIINPGAGNNGNIKNITAGTFRLIACL
ncbi:MAG: carbohydrate porin [Bacteroidales bacterium]|nr:carbohydrate porin [Bacteroidales bacterium]